MALELATAYVSLSVSGRGLQAAISTQLRDATKEAGPAGERAGASFAAGAAKAGRGLAPTLAVDPGTARRSGEHAGTAFASGLQAKAAGVGIDVDPAGAGRSGDRAAKAFGRSFERGLDRVEGDAERAGERAGDGFGAGLGRKLAAAAAAAGVGAFLKSAVSAASDLNETVSKTQVIFGDAAKRVIAFSEAASTAFGQSQRQALDAASTFAVFGKSAGLGGDELAGFAERLTVLASDMASFNNTSPEEAIVAIGAALRGESEPIRAYGVLLDDASLRQEALRQGLISTVKDALTPQQRVLAATAAIFKQTSDAQGDFARTSSGLANTTRSVAAQFEEAKAKLGQAFLPVVLTLANALSKSLLPALADAAPIVAALVGDLAKVGGAVAGILGPIAPVVAALSGLAGAMLAGQAAALKLVSIGQSVFTAIKGLASSAATLTGGIGLAVGAIGALAAVLYVRHQQAVADAKKAQESLAEALRRGHDPTQTAADDFRRLADELIGVKKASDGTGEALPVSAFSELTKKLSDKGLLGALNRAGVDLTTVFNLVSSGSNSFQRYGEQVLSVAEANNQLKGTERDVAAALLEAVDAGKISRREFNKLGEVLDAAADAADDNREANLLAAKRVVENAVAVGQLSQAFVDQALAGKNAAQQATFYVSAATAIKEADEAAAKAAEEAAKAHKDHGDVLATLPEVIGAVAPENRDLARSAGEVADATGDAKQATENIVGVYDSAADRAKILAERVDLLKRLQDEYAGKGPDYEAAVDGFRDSLQDLTLGVAENGTSFDALTLKGRANRDAFRDVEAAAASAVEAIRAAGGTADEQQLALGGFASEVRSVALNIGLTSDEAERLTQRILGIPTEWTVRVKIDAELTDVYRRLGESIVSVGGDPLPGLARGGLARAGRPYVVGEDGPEVFVPSVTGTIIPNSQLTGRLVTVPNSPGQAPSAGLNIESLNVVNPVDATADEVVSAIGSKLGWLLTTRSER